MDQMSDAAPFLPSAVQGPLQAFADRLHLATLPGHAHQIITAFVLYYTTFAYVSPALSKWSIPNIYGKFPRRTQINWHVHTTSQIQSIFINSFALYVILSGQDEPNTTWQDRLWGYSPISGTVQACAAGYFMWDILVSSKHLSILGLGSLLHAVAAFVITCIGFRPFANFYGLRFVLYELSTPFLNVHWFFDKLNMTGSTPQFWNGLALLASFFGCRIVWGTYQSYYLYADAWAAYQASINGECQQTGSTVRDTVAKVLGSKTPGCDAVPVKLLVIYVASNTLLSLLNIYWFWKMIAAVKKRFTSKDPPEPTEKD